MLCYNIYKDIVLADVTLHIYPKKNARSAMVMID